MTYRVTYADGDEILAVEVETAAGWVRAEASSPAADTVNVSPDARAVSAQPCEPEPGYCFVVILGVCYYYPCSVVVLDP